MKILNFGSMNIDKVYQVSHFVRPGETISSESYKCFPGGKGLNQSIAAARAGADVFHAGTIGPDGEFLKEVMAESGVDVRHVRRIDDVTGHALIQVEASGENCIILFPGSNAQNDRAYIDGVLEHFQEGDILLLQNEINNLDYLLQRGKQKGMRILLNPSPISGVLKRTELSGVTWLMLNRLEGEELTGETEPDKILGRLCERYPDMKVILTMGKEGSVYYDAQRTVRQACVKADAVDTTAAGDTFTGYFLAALAEGGSVETALERAATAAALAVSREGAAVSIPLKHEVDERISI